MTWGKRIALFILGLFIGGFLVVLSTVAFGQQAVCPEGYLCTWSGTSSSVDTTGSMTTRVESPPPSAISPSFSSGNGNDLCTVGVAGAVQTQILGISAGRTVRDMNCEKLKNAKTLYDMGMKVAAVSVMCQDERVFKAMMDAGTPCPYDGAIGDQAKSMWESNPDRIPGGDRKGLFSGTNETTRGIGAVIGVLGLLLAF